MKPNVDLTENQMFSSGSTRISLSTSNTPFNLDLLQLLKHSYFHFPWDLETKHNLEQGSDGDYRIELILTGNRTDRERKRKWIQYEEGMECDGCGKDISKKPWKKVALTNYYHPLCLECILFLEENAADGWMFSRAST